MGFSAAKRKFWARKDQIRTRTLANLPSNQYIDIFPSARQTGFQQQITETFPVTGMRSPVRSIWKTSVLPCSSWHSTRSLLFGRKKATLWVLHTWIKLSRLLVFFFFPVFSCMKLRSGSKQTTVTAWKVYCRWFYICHWSWTSGVPLGQTAKNTW